MKVTIEKLPQSKVRIKFEAPQEMVDRYIREALSRLSHDVNIPGFRPGHAPQHMLEAKIGTEKIHNKALELLFPFAYAEAITQEKITAVGRPSVKVLKFAPGNPAEFEAEVSVLPEIGEINYKKLIVEKHSSSVNNDEINNVLESLRRREAQLVPKEGKAERGDWAEIDFSGVKNGIKMERLASKNYPFVLGDGMLLPDFEKNIQGMSAGQEKTFEVRFPEDYNDKEFAGQLVKFTAKVNKIQKFELPELTEEFIKKISNGNESTVEGLKKDIKDALLKQKEQEERIRREEEIITQVTEKTKLDLPEDLVQDEFGEMKTDVLRKLESQGLTLEKYLEYTKKTQEEYDEDLRKEAIRKIKIGLILNKIAELEGIEVTEEEREAEVDRLREITIKDPSKTFNEDETRRYVTIILKHRKVIERLLEYATK